MKRLVYIISILLLIALTVSSCAKAPTVEISEDGYWVINGEKTDVLAKGEKGDTGEKGEKGDPGKGIVSIALVKEAGRQKQYKVTYTEGQPYFFIVTDGADGVSATHSWDGTTLIGHPTSERFS